MRIITGKYGGRQIKSPKSHRVHPMAEKVRGALFNSLGDISGTTVLDAYGGSGAVAIEAVSRGAESVVTIEIDKTVFQTLRENVELLGLTDQIKSTQPPHLDARADFSVSNGRSASRRSTDSTVIGVAEQKIRAGAKNTSGVYGSAEEQAGVVRRLWAIRANCLSWSANNPTAKFDIIILDPPYDKIKVEAVEKLAAHLNSSGIMILSHPGRAEVPYAHGVVVVETRLYGDAALTSYRLGQ